MLILGSRRHVSQAALLCLFLAVRNAASMSAPNKDSIPHATDQTRQVEVTQDATFRRTQQISDGNPAAAIETGQGFGKASTTTAVASSDESVDCVWDSWVDWSVCQFSCGGGESVRTRKVKIMAHGDGAACDTNDRETRVCNKNPCPLDCMWDEWSPWGVCSVTCGPGTKTKTRDKKQYQQYGGATCVGHWSLATPCEERVCAVDCKWGDWGDWEGCSKSCGVGASSRYRTKAQVKNMYGKECVGDNFQTEKCGMNACPVDCAMEDWGAWEPCDVTCGSGSTKRARKVLSHPTYGGEMCGPSTEEKTCDNGLCPVHCEVSDWSQWSDCSLTCTSENTVGIAKRTRKVVQTNNALGDACEGDLEQTIGCSRTPCPVDCKLSEWTAWSQCSTSCGPGISERARAVSMPAQYGGRDCHEEAYQKKYCTSDICPIDCQWADWQDWLSCSITCANGTSSRMRLVKTPMLHGGRECAGGSQQSRVCNAAFCPIHCQWDDWTVWSQCSTTCGDGSESRGREIKVKPLYGGNACNGSSSDVRTCDQVGCPVQCKWSDWSTYGSCTSSCGSGQHSRTREKSVVAQNGGADCTGDDKETDACPDLPPCPVDCEWDDWSEWEACSITCGKGVMRRSRIRKVYEKDGGHTCYGYEDDEKACESEPCPVDCSLGSWTKWSECSSSCGGGEQMRTRQIVVMAAAGGVACNTSDLRQTATCEDMPCPVHCEWDHWSEWSTCTKECEGGVTYRHRAEGVVAEYGGKQCEGSADEEMMCNAHGCPVDCKFDEWSEWSDCSKSCNSGNRTAARLLITAPQWGGQPCDGGIMKTEWCNEQPCPEDCSWGDWSHYSICSKTCGGGEMLRNRPRVGQMYGGSPCLGNDTEATACNTQGCPQDCEWGSWSEWTSCSKDCGGGSIKRFREVVVEKDFGGDPCFGSDTQEAGCNFDVCAIHCEWNDWDLWSPCSKSCNGGTRSKSRSKKWDSSNGGMPCVGNATDMEKCNTEPCPVDCTFELWEPWGDCSTSCGLGSRFRTRVKKEESYGGAPCQDVMWEVGDCSNPPSPNCPKPTTSTTTSLAVLKLPEGQLAWSHLHNVWEPQASRGPLAVPSHRVLSKTFTESKDPSYQGKAYKPCKAGELNKTLEAFEAMKKAGGDMNASETDAVKVIDEIVANMSGGQPNALNLGLNASPEALSKPFDTSNLKVVAKSEPDTDQSKTFADAFDSSSKKLKDGKDVVAEVAGDLGLDVMEADEFAGNKNVTVAMANAIAALAGAKASDVKVDITIPQAILLSTWQRKVKGNVNVAYMVEVYKQDESKGNASLLASRISTSDIDSVTSEIREQVLAHGLTFTLRAVSLSVTVLPVTTDGNIDVLGASVDALTNSSVEDAVPTAVLDGKAKATPASAMVETVQKQAKLHSPLSKERRKEVMPGSVEEQGAEGAKSAAMHHVFSNAFVGACIFLSFF